MDWSIQSTLIFLVSGFLFTLKDNWSVFISKKIPRLVIPYISFGLLVISTKMLFAPFTHSGAPDLLTSLLNIVTGRSYWFLYALFLIMITCKVVCSWKRYQTYSLFFLSLVFIVISLILRNEGIKQSSTFYRYFFFLPFFASGYFFKKFYSVIRPLVFNYYYIIMLVFAILFILDNILLSPKAPFFIYLQALLGIFFCWALGCGISRVPLFVYPNRLLSYFGVYSLQFYVNHLLIMLPCFYVASFAKLPNPYLSLFCIFLLAIFIAWIMLLFEKKWSWSRWLCGLK